MGCRWKRVWLCKQNQICDGGAGSQSDSAAAQLDRVGSVWWQQSVAIVSCCSLILSPSYAASMPYQARISAAAALCKLLLAQVSIQQSGRRRRQVNARLLAALFQCSQYWSAMTECQFMADFWPMVMAVTNLMATLAFVLSICVFLHLAHSLCLALGSNDVHT